MKIKQLQANLTKTFGADRISVNVPLSKHCNWRIGGPADLFVTVRTAEELTQAVRAAQQQNHKPTIVGFGANVLVSDKGIRGLVILNRAHRILFEQNQIIEADSGTNLAVLTKEAAKQGVGGLEFLIGIPGTVGAAVAVNAGTREQWISAFVVKALILKSDGQQVWLNRDELDFSYRNSKLKQTGEVVITARLQGKPDDPVNIERKLKEELKVRKTQPTGPSAGSVFTNPTGDFAGRLIEACGLKGLQIGGAQISEMHANFILNIDDAKAKDVKEIIEKIKSLVAWKFSIQLEEEIRYLGEW